MADPIAYGLSLNELLLAAATAVVTAAGALWKRAQEAKASPPPDVVLAGGAIADLQPMRDLAAQVKRVGDLLEEMIRRQEIAAEQRDRDRIDRLQEQVERLLGQLAHQPYRG